MRRGDSAVRLPWPPLRYDLPVQQKVAVKTSPPAPPLDRSRPASCVRYSSFVLLGVLITSATLLAAPALLFERMEDSKRRHFLLDEDLKRSRDPSVHPCDDFYQHVCGRWDTNLKRHHRSPLDKYKNAFEGRVFKELLLRPTPKRSVKARDKASAILLSCLSRTGRKNTWSLRKVLLDLGLSWPEKSTTTRAALLHILVKSSLHFGIHAFWAFYIGPDPQHYHQSTIYMTLDQRCIEWIRDFELLITQGRHDDYLRRCAEIVGGTGQSYSTMIEAVTVAHRRILEQVHLLWDPTAMFAFYKLSDPELRRAINAHLPDDSQFWPEDEIVNMDPALFDELNATHLHQASLTEGFKLFLGAYVVWILSPFVSRYLTTSMLDDMGWAKTEQGHRYDKCLDALEFVMPLAKWKLEHDAQGNGMNTWTMMGLSVRSFHDVHRVYGAVFQRRFSTIMKRLSANAHNMTITWSMLDRAYAYVRVDNGAGFFGAYLSALSRGTNFLKQLLRKTGPAILHAPGISSIHDYRIFVARELIVRNFLATPPLFDTTHPLAVHAALLATVICRQITILARFVFVFNKRYSGIGDDCAVYMQHGTKSLAIRHFELLVSDLVRYETMVKASGFPPNQTQRETRELTVAGYAARTASNILRLPEAQAKAASTKTEQRPVRQPFHGVPEEQLYFLVACFTHCGSSAGRRRDVQGHLQRCHAFRGRLQERIPVPAAASVDEQFHMAENTRCDEQFCAISCYKYA